MESTPGLINQDFLAHYDREHSAVHPVSDEFEELLKPADSWGMFFGRVLYDYLADDDDAGTGQQLAERIVDYKNWIQQSLGRGSTLDNIVNSDHLDPKERSEVFWRLQFHRLNYALLDAWSLEYYRGDNYNESVWQEVCYQSQLSLGILAAKEFVQRNKMASDKESYAYFNEASAVQRSDTEGSLTEYDAAVVLLEIAKKAALTIVPAPPQFEHGAHPRSNIDFVAIGENRQAVGIQAKAHVNRQKLDQYDSHVVLLDGQTDLGNQIAKRTRTERYTPRVVGWAGILSVQQLSNLSIKRMRVELGASGLLNQAMALRLQTKQALKGVKDGLPLAVERFEPRLLHYFNQSASVNKVVGEEGIEPSIR